MSTHALPVQIALVDQTGRIQPRDLAEVAGALTEQVMSDFAPIWHVRAAVTAPAVPGPHQWVVEIDDRLDEPGALGYHADSNGQPYAKVQLTSDWTTTASHEVLEMLADPFGYRMHGARLPGGLEDRYVDFGLPHHSTHVHYLLEVCDPPEAATYEVGGVEVSDFLTPAWYRTSPSAKPVDHLAVLGAPRELAPGGYVSFANADGEWFQAFADNNSGKLTTSDLGHFDRSKHGSLREFTDYHARMSRAS